jgi:hypothetical protein
MRSKSASSATSYAAATRSAAVRPGCGVVAGMVGATERKRKREVRREK